MSKQDSKIENRLEVFLTNLKFSLPTSLLLGAVLFAFFLPIVVIYAIQSYMVSEIIETADVYTIYNIYNTCNLIKIPAFMVFGIGLAGCGQIVKNMCWGNVLHFGDDFKTGVKQNWLQCLIISGIVGVINFAIGLNYIILNSEVEAWKTVLSTISVFLPILLSPALIFIYNQIVIYNQKLFKIVKFSFQIYITSILKTLLVFILTLSPYLLMLIPNTTFHVILLAALALWYFPFLLQIYFLFSCSVFDKTINPNNFPEIINKGIDK